MASLFSSCGLVKLGGLAQNACTILTIPQAVSQLEQIASAQSCTTCHNGGGALPWTLPGPTQVPDVLSVVNTASPNAPLLYGMAFNGHYGSQATSPNQLTWLNAVSAVASAETGVPPAGCSGGASAPTTGPVTAPVGNGVFDPSTWVASPDYTLPATIAKAPKATVVSIPLSSISSELTGVSLTFNLAIDASVSTLLDISDVAIVTGTTPIQLQGIVFEFDDTVNLQQGEDLQAVSVNAQAGLTTIISTQGLTMAPPTSGTITLRALFGSIGTGTSNNGETCTDLTDFTGEVRPIITNMCATCHNGSNQSATAFWNSTFPDAELCPLVKNLATLPVTSSQFYEDPTGMNGHSVVNGFGATQQAAIADWRSKESQ
jgi:hypothetical protein